MPIQPSGLGRLRIENHGPRLGRFIAPAAIANELGVLLAGKTRPFRNLRVRLLRCSKTFGDAVCRCSLPRGAKVRDLWLKPRWIEAMTASTTELMSAKGYVRAHSLGSVAHRHQFRSSAAILGMMTNCGYDAECAKQADDSEVRASQTKNSGVDGKDGHRCFLTLLRAPAFQSSSELLHKMLRRRLAFLSFLDPVARTV